MYMIQTIIRQSIVKYLESEPGCLTIGRQFPGRPSLDLGCAALPNLSPWLQAALAGIYLLYCAIVTAAFIVPDL